jgi:exonuclease 1
VCSQKLSFSQDSDVLVYLAVVHSSSPVICKLDKDTGSCDVVSMDWLLNYRKAQETAFSFTKPGTSVEMSLLTLASHEAVRPGFGVRLFVQGCVLAGCDYAPAIEHVSISSAFKHVRNHARRNDTVRFKSILGSLPKTIMANIDATKHEKMLAQSEAVFYYHVVAHQDRGNRPLCEPRRFDHIEARVEQSQDYHRPLMTRFDNCSFIGDTSSPE